MKDVSPPHHIKVDPTGGIVLDEGTRGVGEEAVWVEEEGESVLVVVCGDGDALRERNLLEATETGFLSSFFEC